MSTVPLSKSASCAACRKSIRTAQQMQCSKCASHFHAICVNVTDLRSLTEEARSNWICPLCKGNLPRGDNSNTPVRSAATDLPCVPSTSRKLNPLAAVCSPVVTPDPDPLETLVIEMKLMREDVGDMKSQMKLLSEHLASRLDEFSTKFRKLEERDAARESEVCSLRSTVIELQEQLNSRAQAGLKNEIEISGIAESRNENLMHITRVIAKKIGVDLDNSDIDFVMRVGPRRPNSDDAPSKLPRPVVIRFVRRHIREDFLKESKSRRTLTSADIGVEGPSRKLYFNERLTQENRYLFRTARLRSNEAGFKYCWVKNGIIHVRRQEGGTVTAIKSPADLERHLGQTSVNRPPPAVDI